MSKAYQINANFHDVEDVIRITKKYGDTEYPFFGENENGEDIIVSVFNDKVVVVTYQSNRWVRNNTYWTDGTIEETFDGKWE